MPATMGALGTVGQLPEGLLLEPGVATAIAEHLGGASDECRVDDLATAGGAERERQRHAPDTLAGDAPIGTRLDHAADAQGSAFRDEADVLDRLETVAAELAVIERYRPLFGGAEHDRALATPAVRVTVRDGGGMVQEPARLQIFDDRRVGVEDALAHPRPDLLREAPPVVDGREDRQAVFAAREKIIHPVARGGVHRAGAGVPGHVLAQDEAREPLRREGIRGARRGGVLHVASLDRAQNGARLQPLQGQDPRHEVACQEQHLVSDVDELVRELGVQSDRHIGRQRPGCRRPDQD